MKNEDKIKLRLIEMARELLTLPRTHHDFQAFTCLALKEAGRKFDEVILAKELVDEIERNYVPKFTVVEGVVDSFFMGKIPRPKWMPQDVLDRLRKLEKQYRRGFNYGSTSKMIEDGSYDLFLELRLELLDDLKKRYTEKETIA